MRSLIRASRLFAAGLAGAALLVPAGALAAGVLQFDDPRLVVREGQDDWITVVRTGSATGTATVVLNVALGGTARPGEDFLVDLPLGVVQLADGELFAHVRLEVPQDSRVEGTEYASLTLSSPAGATLARETSLLLQIEDDDDPAATLVLTGQEIRRVDEGAALAIPVDRDGLSGQTVGITLVGTPGTAALGIDYTDVTTVFSYGGNETTKSGELLTIEDDEVEGPETLTLLLASPTPEGQAAFTGIGPLVVIEDDDGEPAGEFGVFALADEVSESAGTAEFNVDRNRGSSGAATVRWSTIDGPEDGDALADVDYLPTTGELAFAEGETRKTLSVTLIDDNTAKTDRRRFAVVLGDPTLPAGLDPEGRVAYVAIREDDGRKDDDDDCSGVCDCFIATAAWGSWMDPHVVSLRAFRDDVLMRSPQGRAFVAFYYRHSPPLAAFIGGHDALRAVARAALAPVVFGVEQPLGAAMLLAGALLGLNLRRRATRNR
jgi:hypothetical protein